jgi:hypothetical protein
MYYRSGMHVVRGLCAAALIGLTGVLVYAQDEAPDDADVPAKRGAPAAEAAPESTAPPPAAAAATTGEPAAPPEAAAAPAAPPAPPGPRQVQAGAYTVESRGPWTAQDRLSARTPELWIAYMHGVVDVFAQPASWDDLLADGQPAETWLDKALPLQSPYRSCPMPALRLAANQELLTGAALIPAARLRELAGKTVRVFVWMSANDSGQDRYLWNAVPRLDVVLTNAAGRLLTAVPGVMATRGTFPWHCYYRDVVIPELARQLESTSGTALADGLVRTGGLYLRALNPASGTAWFSTPSWEVVEAANTYTPGDLQDPATGSTAPNAHYDELPVHLSSPQVCYRGLAPAYEWAFLAGASGGAANVPNVLAKEGLDAYLTAARRDPHQLIQGLTRLPEWYHAGTTFKCLPATDPDWLAFLGGRMVAAQDAETGFWGYEKEPRSLAVTAAVVQRMFGGDAFKRADRPFSPQPWLACGDIPVPNPDHIVKTVLGLQGTVGDKRAVKGGWSAMATNCASAELIAAEVSCSLAATADAVFLLRRCAEDLPPALQVRRDRAIHEAIEHAWAACLLPSGLWKQSSLNAGPTAGGVMARLIEASPLLEFRTNPAVELPRLAEEVTPDQGVVKIECPEPSAETVAVRIYMLPEGVGPEKLSDSYLAGIIQTSDGDVRTMDPLAAVQTMRDLARAQWGVGGFEEYGYSTWKLSQLPATLQVSTKGRPVAIVLPRDGKVSLYACNVNAYGETSRPLAIRVKVVERVAAAEPTTEPAAEPADKAAAQPGDTAPGGGVWDEPADAPAAKDAVQPDAAPVATPTADPAAAAPAATPATAPAEGAPEKKAAEEPAAAW